MGKVKVFKGSPMYSQGATSIYQRSPSLRSASYEQQYQALMGALFGFSDFWKKNLESLGGYEVEEVLTNCKDLQLKWAEEHHVKLQSDDWQREVLLHQIAHYQPDILFAHDYNVFDNHFLKNIKQQVPSIKMVIGWDGILLHDPARFQEFDLMLSPLRLTADFYKSAGKRAYYFPFGFETSIMDSLKQVKEKRYEVSFVGSIFSKAHRERMELLVFLSKHIKLSLWGAHFPKKNEKKEWFPWAYPQRQRLLNRQWQEWWAIWKLAPINQGGVFGIDMYQVLAESMITLNKHIDVVPNAEAANMRLYEATGVGTCLVTDYKENLNDIFTIDEEVVAYKSKEECLDKVKYLLKHPKECARIAKAGQKKVMENYSFRKRVLDFVPYLEQLLEEKI